MTSGFRATTTRRALLCFAAIGTAALMAGCASVLEGDGSAGGGAGDQPGSTAYEHGSGAGDVLVSVKSEGSYSPLTYVLRNTAEFTLLGDGTAVVQGPMIEIYPGPAINPLRSSPLTEQQIQELYAAADRAGLLGEEIDYGEPGVTDLATTTVSITVGDRTVSQSAYALYGFGDDAAVGLSEGQIAAREATQGFIDTAHAMVEADSDPYVSRAIAAFRLNPDQVAVEPELEQQPLTWPVTTVPPPLAEPSQSCVIINGTEAAQLHEVLAGANELTPWLVGADPPAYFVFRPLLPDDPGCEQ